jgi:opacity protein-like surface antigen
MKIGRLLAIVVALTLGTSVLALAQEARKTGLTVGYPGDIGVLWHASDSIAIRPTFGFSHTSSDIASGGANDGWGFGTTIAALFYVKKYDDVHTYVSPRFSYSHASVTSTPTSSLGSLPAVTSHDDSTGGAGAFGVQYSPGQRFSVYGEVGIGFTHHETTLNGVSSFTTKGTTWGTVAGLGIVFYL